MPSPTKVRVAPLLLNIALTVSLAACAPSTGEPDADGVAASTTTTSLETTTTTTVSTTTTVPLTTTTTAPTTTTTEPYELPEGIQFDADSGGQALEGEVETFLTWANEAFGEIFGDEVTEATVFIYESLDGQREAVSSFLGVDPAHLNFGPRAQAWPRAIGFYTGRMDLGQHVIIHELFHVLQHQQIHPDGELLPLVPSWIAEGGAEYAAFTVRREVRRLSGPNTDPGSGCHGLEQSLADLEADAVGGQVYCHGLNAVRLLVEDSGDESMLEFWERQAEGASWKEAFQDTFGKTVEEFYAEFDEWNAEADEWPDWIKWRPGDETGPISPEEDDPAEDG